MNFTDVKTYQNKAILVIVVDEAQECILGILVCYPEQTYYVDACQSHACMQFIPSVQCVPCLLPTYEDCERNLTVLFFCLDQFFVCTKSEHYEDTVIRVGINPIELFHSKFNFEVLSFDDFLQNYQSNILRAASEVEQQNVKTHPLY
jgi:hypothetical protein